ncbi:hypothetical protein BDI4_860003 [Burkholderia diffusa]|nr:hypothetical protein BDI4_860003 [Burkholderia diffusa]
MAAGTARAEGRAAVERRGRSARYLSGARAAAVPHADIEPAGPTDPPTRAILLPTRPTPACITRRHAQCNPLFPLVVHAAGCPRAPT